MPVEVVKDQSSGSLQRKNSNNFLRRFLCFGERKQRKVEIQNLAVTPRHYGWVVTENKLKGNWKISNQMQFISSKRNRKKYNK